MKKNAIKETIVVEGRHDESRIKAIVNANVLITNGTHISKEFIELCKEIAAKDGIIIFSDPDNPGNFIRNILSKNIPSAKHAVLVNKQKKIGVEHASDQEILDALMNAKALFNEHDNISLSKEEFYDLKLMGNTKSSFLRETLCKKLRLPKANSKQMYTYINMLKLTKKDIENLLYD